MCCPVGPLVADLQLWGSCWCKIKRICPFYLHGGGGGEGGLSDSLPELQCSTAELLRVAVCAQVDPRLSGAGKSRLFHLVPGAVIRVTLAALSGCWIWPL